MSTTAAVEQPPPFPPVIEEHAYKPHSGHGSVGPVIGVVAVIMVMGAVAVVIGRICSGRRVMGHVQYDFEGWMETKCSTCIDGRLGPPPPREPVPVVVVVESNGPSNEAEPPADVAEGTSNHQAQEQRNIHEN
ncbi:hypothetical protein L1987_39902 [Smallanthus sonchifolius]|uniref:Uncharacterized protein n=1 Tax=Smallanthus sonchifolius TaxID=185202 RepID=A0ACB9GT99_9ASTR|nr:hypothetical protein L1987_39902 [Smallanthus sonchifolius]